MVLDAGFWFTRCLYHSCQKSGWPGSRNGVEGRLPSEQGVYISGTPVWYVGHDPLNFGSMTRVDCMEGDFLSANCFSQKIKLEQIKKIEHMGSTSQRQLTSSRRISSASSPRSTHKAIPNPSPKKMSSQSFICSRPAVPLSLRPPLAITQAAMMAMEERSTAGRSATAVWDWDHPDGCRCTWQDGDGAYGGRTAVGCLLSWVLIRPQQPWNGIMTRSRTYVDPLSFPTLDLGRSTLGRGTRHRPRFLLLWFIPLAVIS